jgi:hypothetical protein
MSEQSLRKLQDEIELTTGTKPCTVILLFSNLQKYGGMGIGVNLLDRSDMVDLVSYLIRKLEITVDDIEEHDALSDEIKYMMKKVITDD